MEVVVTLLLLAAGICNCAFGGTLSTSGLRRDVTSPLDTFPAVAQSRDPHRPPVMRGTRDLASLAVEHGPVSVVQDWSLVCVQLCGAALGGDICTPYCTTITVPVSVQKSNAEILLSPNKDVICNDLCALKLGGSVCTCSSVATVRSVQNRNQVCHSFCVHNMETLAGCSLCNVINPPNQLVTHVVGELVERATAAATKGTKLGIDVHSLNPAATNEETTPDWDALCASLCKTGDGGSLCSCDLSPFF